MYHNVSGYGSVAAKIRVGFSVQERAIRKVTEFRVTKFRSNGL